MRLLVTCGGEAVVPSIAATACDRGGNSCAYDHIALDSMHTVDDAVTVSDLGDVDLDDLVDACARFLTWGGWDEALGDDTAQTARDLVAVALDVASDYPIGTRLACRYDPDTGWTYTPV